MMNGIRPMKDIVKAEFDRFIMHISGMDGVRRIYLFGSYAYGEPNEDSDIDLLVVVDDSVNVQKRMVQISRDLAYDRHVQVDVLVDNASSFNERSAPESVTLQREIKEKGVLVYGE